MKVALIVLVTVALCSGTIQARQHEATPVSPVGQGNSEGRFVIYRDDMESGAPGWYSVDESAQAPMFHIDTYYAYGEEDKTPPHLSYWCGEINPNFASGDGYGNHWDQRLEIPPVDWTGAVYPVLTFCCRYDSEPDYDFTWFEVQKWGVYEKLNTGYCGPSGGWIDYGPYGYVVLDYDNPMMARFRFVSDGAWSDEDGLYDSWAGAFHVDNIKLFDFYGGTVYFFDDAQGGAICTPSGPEASGDYWHIVTDYCSSYSPAHSWWCGDDADTSLIPPNLKDALYSPIIDISSCVTCTVRYAIHAEVPTVDNDYWTNSVSTDGGVTWYQTGAWWGDFGRCGGWGTSGLNGDSVDPYLPGTGDFQYRLGFYTTDNGCGPGSAGGAGINLDDTWLVADCWADPLETREELSSWGLIKAMFK